MTTFNSERNANWQKHKWQTVITVLALYLCVAGLVTISVVSFFQTKLAFDPLNDSGIPIIGGWVSVALAFVFQYGQNAALYVKKYYATGQHAFTFLFWNVTDKTVCDWVFGICAVIDAGTNCLWLSTQTDVAIQAWYFRLLEYSAMVGIVFVEEVLGIVLQAAAHATTELQKIMVREQSQNSNKPSAPQVKPNNNHQVPNFRPTYKGDVLARLANEVMKEQKPAPTPPARPLYQGPTYLGMQEQKPHKHPFGE